MNVVTGREGGKLVRRLPRAAGVGAGRRPPRAGEPMSGPVQPPSADVWRRAGAAVSAHSSAGSPRPCAERIGRLSNVL